MVIRTATWAATDGPSAQAQALGAPEAVRFDTYWNAPELPDDVPGGVVDRRTWLDAVDEHLRGRPINATPGERALDLREDVLDHRPDSHLGIDEWLTAVASAQEAQRWTDAEAESVSRAAVKAFHIERQLITEGLLGDDRRVWTYMAHDLAVAVHLAQSGCRLGFADEETATEILAAARDNAAALFSDWSQFACSWVAGQSCLYGSYPCDDVWRDATGITGGLLTDSGSPWVTLPFPGSGRTR